MTCLISVDTETTGFSEIKHEIIEIGAIKVSREGKIIDIFSKLARPVISEITAEITKVNNITPDMVKNEKTSPEVVQEFIDWAGEQNILLAHNAVFDMKMIYGKYIKENKPFPDHLVICTKEWARSLRLPTPNNKLEILCEYIKYDLKNAHRATCDAKGCLAVLNHFIAKIHKPKDEKETLELIMKNAKLLTDVLKSDNRYRP